MLIAKQSFDDSISRIKSIHGLYVHLIDDLHFSKDIVSDILRSEIVYVISALDRLLHDLIKQGMLEIFHSQRSQTVSYNNFQIRMEQMQEILNPVSTMGPDKILEDIIINKHKFIAYQDLDKIADGLSLIWPEQHKWQKIALPMAMPENDVKIELKNIFIRRNQIVHESDIDLFTKKLQSIKAEDVVRSVDFIKKLGDTIYSLVK